MLSATATLALGLIPSPAAHAQQRLNPVIDLVAAGKPVFGLYAPANRRARPGQPALAADSMKSMAQLAAEALAYKKLDYVFEGTMEYNFEQSFPPFTECRTAGRSPRGRRRASHTRCS
jgi:hypothetical protein